MNRTQSIFRVRSPLTVNIYIYFIMKQPRSIQVKQLLEITFNSLSGIDDKHIGKIIQHIYIQQFSTAVLSGESEDTFTIATANEAGRKEKAILTIIAAEKASRS